MSVIDASISISTLSELATWSLTSTISAVACRVLSALARVIAAISSIDAEVSSREAACSVAPVGSTPPLENAALPTGNDTIGMMASATP